MKKLLKFLLALCVFLPATAAWGQTGKIAGVVTDASTGDPLPGVNVAIEGTTQGAVTDVEGYYVILNVRPGSYNLRATFIGFTPAVRQDIRVNIDLTTEIDFALQEEAVGLDEIVVAAETPVVQRDVSASVANITAEQIENLPVTDVQQVVGLQAGFERGLTIRGEGGSQVQFSVDGMSMNSGVDNDPFTGVSYTSVQEVQVQTGGFNAEYGNVRSGLVNVITKQPAGDRYTVDAIVRYSPASSSMFAGSDVDGREVQGPDSRRTFDLRPLFDPDVAMDGVGSWPAWKQDEYRTWNGWNAVATAYNSTNGTDFTGAQLQQVFAEHYLRKEMEVEEPNYEIDATIGGPVPGLNRLLGDLRFLASYRQEQEAYPMAGYARDAFQERVASGKLVSSFAPGMTLTLQGMYSEQDGLNRREDGRQFMVFGRTPYYPWDGSQNDMFSTVGNGDQGRNIGELFTDLAYHLMDVDRLMLGGQFTHTLSPSTFYEVQVQSMSTNYHTRTITPRNEEETFSYLGGAITLNEEPFGYTFKDRQDKFGVGMITAGHWGSGYDFSTTQNISGRFDLTSQVNRYALVKTGVEYIYNDYDIDFGEDDPEHPHNGDPKWKFHRQPQQASAYAQTKLEFRGMIANIGLRLDYFHAGGDWYIYDYYDRAFSAQFGLDEIDENLEQEPTEHKVALSPRLGVSFPVTDNSKLYFNYGHFRQQLEAIPMFNLQKDFTGKVIGIGNPNHPMPKTVAYELGFEQNLFDQYHLRLAGYYRDLQNQPRGVNFISLDDLVDYTVNLPWNYSDVRGFEATLTRNRGEWVRGFINYTYSVRKSGNFGFSMFDENGVDMAQFVNSTTEHYASKPVPEPFARFNIEVILPETLGPEIAGRHPLGDWRIAFLGEWRQGQTMTWDGNSLSGATGGASNREIQGNVRYRDYYMLDMRLSKNFNIGLGDAQFFVDLTNVLNIRHMYLAGGNLWQNGNQDQQTYMRSLHLPKDVFPDGFGGDYARIYGDDEPGDFRKPGVAYVPILISADRESFEASGTWPLYYAQNEGRYYEYDGSNFVAADQDRVDQVLDDKAYIDMPNRTWGTFLNPRNVYFGLRISF